MNVAFYWNQSLMVWHFITLLIGAVKDLYSLLDASVPLLNSLMLDVEMPLDPMIQNLRC